MENVELALEKIECSIRAVGVGTEYPNTTTLSLDFGKLPQEKLAYLSEVGGRTREENADWMLVMSRLVTALHTQGLLGISVMTRQTKRRFVIECDVETPAVTWAQRILVSYLWRYGVNSGVFL